MGYFASIRELSQPLTSCVNVRLSGMVFKGLLDQHYPC